MKENKEGFVIPEKVEIVTKTVGQIAVVIMVFRLLCNMMTPRIILVEKQSS